MDPSWSEICHFVTFLDIQLQSCEQSVFINKCAGEELSGLKGFVANFMIVMSKVSINKLCVDGVYRLICGAFSVINFAMTNIIMFPVL